MSSSNQVEYRTVTTVGAIKSIKVAFKKQRPIFLWGPPGVGKTTLAEIIANKLDRPFYSLYAISSGVKDIRKIKNTKKKVRRAI